MTTAVNQLQHFLKLELLYRKDYSTENRQKLLISFLLKIKHCDATRQHPFHVTTKAWVLKQHASFADEMTLQPLRVMNDKYKGTRIE